MVTLKNEIAICKKKKKNSSTYTYHTPAPLFLEIQGKEHIPAKTVQEYP